MKLPNSLTGPSNRGASSGRGSSLWHRWIPAWIVTAYLGCFFVWPVIQDLRALFFVPFGLLLGHSYWFTALGLPNSIQLIPAVILAIILFSLPWFSVLSGTRRATTLCTLGVIVVLLMQISGCHLQRQKGNATLNQAQRTCVMQPRVRRTLGNETPHTSVSPNPNGVPSGSTAIARRVSVLECSSPLELFAGSSRALQPSTVIDSRASKVAISLREMSWTHGKLTGAHNSDRMPAGESHSRICCRFAPPFGQPTAGYLPSVGSTERDGYFASPDRRGHAFNFTVDKLESAGGPAHSRTLPRAIEPAFL